MANPIQLKQTKRVSVWSEWIEAVVQAFVTGFDSRSRWKIVSGGHTCAHRAALTLHSSKGLKSGWIPQGRLAEDGSISHRYAGPRETESADPSVLNVSDSEATLIVSRGSPQGGSLLTTHLAESAIGQSPRLPPADPSHRAERDTSCSVWTVRRTCPINLPPFQGET